MRVEPVMMGLVLFKKRKRHQICLFLSCEDTARRQPSARQKRLLKGHQNCQDHDLRLPSFQTVRNKCLLFKPPIYDILVQQPELTKRVFNSRSDSFSITISLQNNWIEFSGCFYLFFPFLQGNFKKYKAVKILPGLQNVHQCQSQSPTHSPKFFPCSLYQKNPGLSRWAWAYLQAHRVWGPWEPERLGILV